MDVPKSEKKLLQFAQDTIQICNYSQGSRAQEAASNLAYYEVGADDGTESLYNRTGIHIDRTSSYLYAPGEIRYSIGFDATTGDSWLARAKAASKYLSREYRRADGDVAFAQGVQIGLIKGCSILKHNWMDPESLSPGLDPFLVHPEFFGVEREDLARLEDQQAMVHTTYLSKEQVTQMVRGRQDEADVLKSLAKLGASDDTQGRLNWLHQIVIGGSQPVTTDGSATSRSQVSMTPSSKTQFSPDMMENLLRMDELWVVDEDRDDYTTIQLIEGLVLLEGKYRHRNLTGVKGMHPFSKICADPVAGYFWGRSEVSRVKMLQDFLSERVNDIRRLLKMQLKPAKGMIGFSGITAQKMRAALTPGGFLQEQNPNAKMQDLITQIPKEAFSEIASIVEMFDEIGGFKPITQGQGEPGVRAGSHARTLMRTASPKLRERALRIERDAETSAHITFKLMQAKEARVFLGAKEDGGPGEHFLLAQMPEDYYVEIDSHSSSPAFIDDARELAFALAKVGAAGPEEVIMMTHPPGEEQLLAAVRRRQAARAKMIQDHPELLTGGKGKGKAA